MISRRFPLMLFIHLVRCLPIQSIITQFSATKPTGREEMAALKASLIEKTYLKIETRLLESYPGAKFPMSAVLFLCDLVPFFNEWVFQSVIERSLKTGYAGSVSLKLSPADRHAYKHAQTDYQQKSA